MFAGKKSAQIREILISESAWEEMTCLFAPSLAVMVQQSKQLSMLCAGMQMFPQSLINVRCQNRFDPSSIPELNQLIKDIERQLTGKGRILLRASGTEPVIRVMVEGTCSETNHIIASQIAEAVRAVSNKLQGL